MIQGLLALGVFILVIYLISKATERKEERTLLKEQFKPSFLSNEKIGLWNNIPDAGTFPPSEQLRKRINLNLMVESYGMSEVDLKKQIISSFKSERNKQSMLDELIQKSIDSAERDNIHPSDTVTGIMTDWIFEYMQLQNR